MSDDVYMDVEAVAEYLGIIPATVRSYVYLGRFPEADFRWHGHNYWLQATIDEWRKYRGKHWQNVPARYRRGTRNNPTPPPLPREPWQLEQPATKRRASVRRRSASTSDRALQIPDGSRVSEEAAREVARDLRGEGLYCTPEDVIVLANDDGEGLEHERSLLRQRILTRLKGRAARR